MKRTTTTVALLMLAAAAVAGCDNGGASSPQGGPDSPWLAVLAEEALSAHDRWDGVSERPVVNVATAAGLERHAGDLSLVHGAVDRETRPQYVLMHDHVGRPPPPIPIEEPATPLPREERFIRGPLILTLDAVEVDTETRKVAVFTVFMTTVPYIGYDGRAKRYMVHRYPSGDRMMQYRVEGRWDGWRWVAEVMLHMEALPEYSNPAVGFGRLPGLHQPDLAPENLPQDLVR